MRWIDEKQSLGKTKVMDIVGGDKFVIGTDGIICSTFTNGVSTFA